MVGMKWKLSLLIFLFLVLGVISMICLKQDTVFCEHVIPINLNKDSNDIIFGGENEEGFYFGVLEEQLIIFFWNYMQSDENPIYIGIDNVAMVDLYIHKDKVIVVEGVVLEDGMLETVITEVSENGKIRTLYKNAGISMAYSCVCGNYLVVNNDKADGGAITSELITIDMDTLKEMSIYKTSYSMVANGIYKGQSIVYAGGNDSEIYFQVITMDRESLEGAKKAEVFKYCFSANQVIEKINLDRKVLHLIGKNNFIILSEYDLDYPLTSSGRIVKIEEHDANVIGDIEGVSSGKDINKSFVKGEDIYFCNTETLYIFSTASCKLESYQFNKTQNVCSKLILGERGLSFLENADGKIYLHRIEKEK